MKVTNYPSDPRLAKLAQDYVFNKEGLIFPKMFPKVLVPSVNFKNINWSKTKNEVTGADTYQSLVDALRAENNATGCYSTPKDKVPAGFSYENHNTQERSASIPLKDCAQSYCEDPGFDPAQIKRDQVTNELLIELELLAVALGLNPASYTAATTLTQTAGRTINANTIVGGVDIDDPADNVKAFFRDVQKGRSGTLSGRGNVAIMGPDEAAALKAHPSMVNISYGRTDDLDNAGLAAALGVSQVIIAEALYNTAIPGAATVVDRFVKGVIWIGRNDLLMTAPDQQSVFFGYSAYTNDMSSRDWLDQLMGGPGGMRNTQWHDITPIVANREAGTLITNLYGA